MVLGSELLAASALVSGLPTSGALFLWWVFAELVRAALPPFPCPRRAPHAQQPLRIIASNVVAICCLTSIPAACRLGTSGTPDLLLCTSAGDSQEALVSWPHTGQAAQRLPLRPSLPRSKPWSLVALSFPSPSLPLCHTGSCSQGHATPRLAGSQVLSHLPSRPSFYCSFSLSPGWQ